MKKTLLFVFFLSTVFAFSQNKQLWEKQSPVNLTKVKQSKKDLPKNEVYSLNISKLKQQLSNVPKRGDFSGQSNVVISFPSADGTFERYRIIEASVMHPELEAKYPGIKSYAGQGVDNATDRIRFSVSPLGLQSMRLSSDKAASFIEPYSNDLTQYTVYKRADKKQDLSNFECEITNQAKGALTGNGSALKNADDSILRTYRIAVSTTGEYTDHHGGSKAQAVAAINTTMTRVNGIFENDFNVTMVLIANTDDVIYTNASTDPYSNGSFNGQLQSTLTSIIGEANYDIGHLFAKASNNGNAGCIGCVCVNGQKGSGFTSRTNPEGDPFDVDYVAHEIGHQFGGNHTWTHGGNEGTNVQMEPGSGSTIMGYAGITGANTDVQSNSDPYFHAATIEQVTNYIKSTSCQTNTNTNNAVPTADAGSNYTIPKGTAFVLTGSGTDANSQDVLTYCWEGLDENNSASQKPSVTSTSAPAFRSYSPTTDTKRYFPRLATIKTGATSWEWEAVPNVARTLDFRLTVRDNRAGGANNNSDDMRVTVNGTAGPFVVNAPNSNVTWNAGTTQSVTWNVAGTTGNGVNAANVDIFLSTDGGDTYPIALASGVTNDGSHDIVIPNNPGTQNRIMVKGANNIFFDISNSNFTIGGAVTCNATVPSNLAVSSIGSTSATLSWTAIPAATYDLRYRVTGTSTWTTNAVTGVPSNLTGLTALTQYEAQVRSKCSGGSNSSYSTSVNFTTTDVQLNYCSSASTNTNDEYISRVQLGSIDNSSGAQFYSDFTALSTNLTKGVSSTIIVTPTWTGTLYNEAYAVWIDYNKDGDFTDAGEQVFAQAPTQATPVSGSFTVPNSTTNGATRMRVSMKYNAAPTSCETFQYGEVEDYTVNIIAGTPDTTAPIITLTGAATINLFVGDTYNEEGATATDNIDGDLTSSIVTASSVDTSIAGSYTVTYNVSDAAGNAATEVVRTVIVTVPADTTIPVITLIGAATINLTVGDSFADPGATASDNEDGNLTSSIVVTGSVNTGVAGTYTLNYNVSDAAGNDATQVSRTVIVSEPSSGGCSGAISSFPYNEGFENGLGLWTQSTTDDINWTIDASGTPSNNTGPSSASEGSDYIYVEASVQGTGYPDARAILNSPCFDVSGLSNAAFNFKYHMFGASDMGRIDLEVSTDNGSTWTSIWNQTGNKGNSWLDASVDLSAYTGNIQLRFNRITGSTWQADIAIDAISLTDGTTSGDICAGVAPWSSGNSYSAGDLVTYSGFLFERTTTGWTNLGPCGTTRDDGAVPQIPSSVDISIYPNPVKGNSLFIKSNIQNIPFIIVNTLGQQVVKGTTSSNIIDISKLDSGLYMIQFEINNKYETRKFIKQ